MGPTGFLIMGVSCSGKTTLGRTLAQKPGWDFFDADDFHSPENIAKMAAGIPLNDSDRAPWLAALHDRLLSTLRAGRYPVLACSALREAYRSQILEGMDGIAVIYLRGSYDLIWSRMRRREGHYMKPSMLRSQFDALEEPKDAIVLDIRMPVKAMIDVIAKKIEDGY
jgi:gluconokinase